MSNKTTLIVPPGIRFISDWKDYSLEDYCFPHILDKKIPGCGYTEYCLTNQQNLILCSPRRILLENKESQHPGEVYYFRNDVEKDLEVDINLNKSTDIKKDESIDESVRAGIYNNMIAKLEGYIYTRLSDPSGPKPIKIIVTYDSFGLLVEMLSKRSKDTFTKFLDINHFQIIVDEFQSIFTDSRFKSNTEMKFIRYLMSLEKVCFVSATPMIDKYLREISIFKDLPYFELDWETASPIRVRKPELKIRKLQTINTTSKKIIDSYKSGEFSVLANPITGELVQSKEAVFYVNSVSNIIGIICSSGLTPEEVNILCANTPSNLLKIQKRLGKKYCIGSVPLKGEPHKMFTFCTRTVYLGADFYSTCARTFVLSDANIESMAVDISLDLPQILGRQRLLENPWKNHAEFYYRTLGPGKKISQEQFKDLINSKIKQTENSLKAFDSMQDPEQKKSIFNMMKTIAETCNYRTDYISIDLVIDSFGNKHEVPVFNNLVLISEQRAFDIQQVDYKDRFTVFNTIKDSGSFCVNKMNKFVEYLRNTKIYFSVRLKTLCETDELSEEEKIEASREASEAFDKYYNILGPVRCKALGYSLDRLRKEIENFKITPEIVYQEFSKFFQVGQRYSKAYIKEKIRKIYADLGLSKTPKATDLEDWCKMKLVKFPDPVLGKPVNGFEILKLK